MIIFGLDLYFPIQMKLSEPAQKKNSPSFLQK